MAIEKELLDQLLAGRDPKDVFNKDGLVDELKKALKAFHDSEGVCECPGKCLVKDGPSA